jgi:hypothetical protein
MITTLVQMTIVGLENATMMLLFATIKAYVQMIIVMKVFVITMKLSVMITTLAQMILAVL